MILTKDSLTGVDLWNHSKTICYYYQRHLSSETEVEKDGAASDPGSVAEALSLTAQTQPPLEDKRPGLPEPEQHPQDETPRDRRGPNHEFMPLTTPEESWKPSS